MGFLSDIVNNIAIPAGQSVIKEKLNETAIHSAIYSGINLLIFITGFLLVVFMPFGYMISYCVAAVLFLGGIGWSLFRLIKNLQTAYPIIKNICIKKSLRKGIATYVRERWPAVRFGEGIIGIGSLFSKDLQKIPSLENIIHVYVLTFFRFIMIFALSLTIYLLAFSFIIKPLLLEQFAHTSMIEIYLFPFVGIWKAIK